MADDRSNPKNWLGPHADSERDWLALRAAERPSYLASALAEYLELREWTPEQLAERLRCAPTQLAKLGLCRRPDRSSVEFHQQVSQIASRFELDYWGLRGILEELALEPNQRQMHWRSEEFFQRPGPRPPALHTTGEFTRTFGAPDAARREGFVGNVRSPQTSRQGKGMEIPSTEPFQASPGVTAPKVSKPRKSWLKRLFDAILKFFSRK